MLAKLQAKSGSSCASLANIGGGYSPAATQAPMAYESCDCANVHDVRGQPLVRTPSAPVVDKERIERGAAPRRFCRVF